MVESIGLVLPGFDAASILEELPDGFCAFDRDWRFIYVNATAERLLRRSRGDLLGTDHWTHYPETAGTLMEQHYRRAMEERVAITFEHPREDRIFQFRIVPLANAGVAVYLHDITEHRRAEMLLRESEDRLRLAAEVVGLGLWDYEPANGKLFWDPRTRELMGLAPDAPINGLDTYLAAIHPDDRARVLERYEDAMAHAAPADLGLEFRVVHSGAERWVQSDGKAFFGPEPGTLRVIGTLFDITPRKHAEQALRESEERLRLAISATGLGTWDHDLKTGQRTWSNSTREIFGLSVDIVLSDAVLTQLIHPDDLAAFNLRYKQAQDPTRGGVYENEFRLRRPNNGDVRWVTLRGQVVFDHHDRPVRAIGIILDVTKERRAEAAIRVSERRLSDVLDAVGDAFFAADAELRFSHVSRRATELWGLPREALLGRRVTEIWPDIEAADSYRALVQVVATGRPVTVEADSGTLPGRWIALDGYPTAEGGVAAAFRDITERRAAEQALRESEDRLRMAVEAGDIGTWDYAPQDGSLRWSDRQKAMFGLAPEAEVTAEIFLERIHPADRATVDRTLRAALDPARSGTIENEFRVIDKQNGLERWVAAIGRSVVENGVVVRCVGLLVDVTARKTVDAERQRFAERLEERVAERTRALAAANTRLTTEIAERERAEKALLQAQRMEAIGHLTGGVAHDFNNLLTVISGNLDMIDAALPPDAKVRSLVAAAQKGAERGARLTGQLLAFARRQTLRPEVVDVNDLLHDFRPLIAHAAGETVATEFRYTEALWRSRLDPTQFQSAVLNLAVNARDAMPLGGRLTISTGNVDLCTADAPPDIPAGRYVAVEVADTGKGMTPDIIDRIFEPFFTTKEVGRGTGLGLSQVYGFVRQSGGTITVESQPGSFTRFRLYLPQTDGDQVAVPAKIVTAPARGSGTVLVVEDDEDVLVMVLVSLERLGYRTLTAGSGPEALSLLAQGAAVDLLFTDVVMPLGMSGIDLARASQRLKPDLKVLLTTGYAAEDGAICPGGDGGFPLLSKPYRQVDLAAKVGEILA